MHLDFLNHFPSFEPLVSCDVKSYMCGVSADGAHRFMLPLHVSALIVQQYSGVD